MVLAGVGNGCWDVADVAGWKADWVMVADEGGVLPGDAEAAVVAERPLNCEFIE